MAASPGGKPYGLLSIFLTATGRVELLKILRPSVFWPRPQVESAMVSFVRNGQKAGQIKSMDIFGQVVHLFMQHRRKMLKACVKFATGRLADIKNWDDIFDKAAVNARRRPEELPADEYVAIANLCYDRLCL